MIVKASLATVRRGLTLVEMLVVVALTVLMMSIIAQIMTATTGAIQVARAYHQLDSDLRAMEGTIKRDLAAATARMTPPLNPKDNLGYFEYGENEFADAQGEDSDDYISFTAQYTDGNLFYGRYLPAPSGVPGGVGPDIRANSNQPVAPIMVSSDTAEVVYFLRNGNLYRRVFLVKPNLKLYHEWAFSTNGSYTGVRAANMPGIGNGVYLGWQALNDISTRPSTNVALPFSTPRQNYGLPFPGQMVFDTFVNVNNSLQKFDSELRPIANSLGDLTKRENRAFKPRFTNDYYTAVYQTDPMTGALTLSGMLPYPDGTPDDFMGSQTANSDGNFDNQINDFDSATYPNLLANQSKRITTPFGVQISEAVILPNSQPLGSYLFPINGDPLNGYDSFAFPYIYPNAYSKTASGKIPLVSNMEVYGSIHGIALEPPNRRYDPNYSAPASYFLPYWNHNPQEISVEDNLPTPGDPATMPGGNIPMVNNQAGFAQTWWGFPTWREQLSPLWVDPLKRLDSPLNVNISQVPYQLQRGMQAYGLSFSNTNAYPGQSSGWLPGMMDYDPATGLQVRNRPQPYNDAMGNGSYFFQNMIGFWQTTWEDELIATNVRSFDVKIFDPSPQIQSYVDLGYFATTTGGTSIAPTSGPAPASTTTYQNWLQGFGHEGRMPPLTTDYRPDAQFPFIPSLGPRYVGDDDAGIVRLRRVWDTWSTDYSATDARTLDPLTSPPFNLAPRPSFPPPYPAPMRGIQVQIRMTDPREERIRTITIHQDFTTRL
jgi:type II secretory pathway component PulJ